MEESWIFFWFPTLTHFITIDGGSGLSLIGSRLPINKRRRKADEEEKDKEDDILAPVYINIMEPKQKNTSCWRLLISVVMLCAALCEYNRVRIEFCLDYFFKKLSVYTELAC